MLARSADVTLAAPGPSSLQPEGFRLVQYRQGAEETLRPLVAASETVLLSGFAIHHHPFLRSVPQNLVVDLYDPTVLENLERFASRPLEEQMGLHGVHVRTYNDLFQLGDFFICATEKQRDYWLGGLTSANRVNPQSYAADPALRRLIDVVPFGLPDRPLPPANTAAGRSLKGQRPGIGADDKVILWGGGVWDWLDPLTAIRAMPLVAKEVPEARLFFMGIRHPNPAVPPSRMAEAAQREAEALGIAGTSVFFNDWAAYEERLGFLADADAGISLHSDHVETRFAIRTRLMDYIWAGLPMVVNGGDTMGELAAERGLGRVVPPGDVEATAAALVEMLTSPPDPGKFDEVRRQFAWPQVAEPLVRYVEQPWRNGPTRGAQQVPAAPGLPAGRWPQKRRSRWPHAGYGDWCRTHANISGGGWPRCKSCT